MEDLVPICFPKLSGINLNRGDLFRVSHQIHNEYKRYTHLSENGVQSPNDRI